MPQLLTEILMQKNLRLLHLLLTQSSWPFAGNDFGRLSRKRKEVQHVNLEFTRTARSTRLLCVLFLLVCFERMGFEHLYPFVTFTLVCS